MSRFLAPLVLALGILAGVCGSGLMPASAKNPPPIAASQPNPDLFTYQGVNLQQYSNDNAALKKTGVWNWRFVDVKGCNSEAIHPAVSAAFSEMTRYGMTITETNDSSAHAVYGNCGTSFASICGGPPVIGCLGRGFPYDNSIDISTDMAAYYDVSQRAIALHELHHATAVLNEQYLLNGSFGSSNDVTIMNTGPNSRHDLSPPEDARWWRTMGSPELKVLGYGFNGAWYVWACGFDANASRLSVLVDMRDGQGPVWSGVTRNLKPDANGCQGIGSPEGLNITPGYVYFLKQESPASWAVSLNETCVTGGLC